MTREKPELFTDIRDFTTLFYAILRCKSSEWLELYIESDLGIRFEIWNLDVSIRGQDFITDHSRLLSSFATSKPDLHGFFF